MPNLKFFNIIIILTLALFVQNCGGKIGADARKYPPDPKKRVQKNIEEGRGFRLMDSVDKSGSMNYEFASSNELWRASLDTIDFMPLASANYSGGIIITDWYSDGNNANEAIKISIRFLTNEVRSDALDIKIFYKKCALNINCAIQERPGKLVAELKRNILNKAAIYEKNKKDKNFKPYKVIDTDKDKD
tara:strand:- start:1085 stop:1651 length:567 start_codon:yes stop_codon:yes gene_type:complete